MPGDKRICAECVGEVHLRKVIAEAGTAQQCGYCDKPGSTVSMDELAERVDTVIDRFYLCTTDGDDQWEEPEGYSLQEVLDGDIGVAEAAQNDLAELLTERWFDRSSHERVMGEDPHFVERSKFAEPLSREWDAMEESLKYQVRLNNPRVVEVLERVFGHVLDDKMETQQGVVVEVGPDRELNAFYRARVYQSLENLETDMKSPEANLGPVPPGQGRAGRMNAQGIPVFYGSLDPRVTIAEVRPPVGSNVVVGRFDVVRPLRLLDLQMLRLIGVSGSMFDPATYERSVRRDFLKILGSKLASPVMPEQEHESYLITQAIADFLATHEKLNLDGILFPSVQLAAAGKMSTDARNVVLFNKSSRVDDTAPRTPLKTQFHLWEFDDDGARLEPQLITEEQQPRIRLPPPGLARSGAYSEPALKLDRGSLQISTIRGVSYTTNDIAVRHTDRSEDRAT